jgi:hypothetical protein
MVYGWKNLMDNPEQISGQEVRLEGLVSGSLIEELGSKKGIHTSISPHPISGLSPIVDDMDATVLVFLPGEFTSTTFQALRTMKDRGYCLTVRGIFEYTPNQKNLGRLEATSYRND